MANRIMLIISRNDLYFFKSLYNMFTIYFFCTFLSCYTNIKYIYFLSNSRSVFMSNKKLKRYWNVRKKKNEHGLDNFSHVLFK